MCFLEILVVLARFPAQRRRKGRLIVVTCCKHLAMVFCVWEVVGRKNLERPRLQRSVLEAFGVFGSGRGDMIPRLFCLIYVNRQCCNGLVA